ncbi:MAG TPA: bifunctional glutamate N-acetyltransferase/amino-acid acetyltransferase ArgJ [Verrucomicrobiae bacterium]|nr:bifunctional glutamate N-acetyltransferase/amino-acid acetyltransferase ArgJ [Verrucomicrobiae bacterium]
MKKQFKEVPGSIVAPQGFLASGVFCDIKRLGTGKGSNKGQKRDLALIVSEVPATVAGMFTTNQVCAAPVKVCVERVKKGIAQAVVVNSGNANACTGKQGLKDAREMTATVAAVYDRRKLKIKTPPAVTDRHYKIQTEHVLVGSTGRIGVTMPMANVKRGILAAAQILGNTPAQAAEAAEAIMTSDTRPKQIAVEFKLGGKTVRIGGICKGAGMIQPGMSATGARPAALHATMLCFITTDAAIDAKALQAALREAVAQSFNRITVDGDMSTNDTVLVLANGLAENPLLVAADVRRLKSKESKVRASSPRLLQAFQAALNHVCLELAKMIVRDGEGVHRVVTVCVNGAKTVQDADAAARAVANSALVKTSWHGGDPNWGRIIDAVGYSQATVEEEKIDIGYSVPGGKKILWSLKRGQPSKATFKQLCAAVAPKEFDLHINLNLGKASAVIYAADLTEEYVDFNKGDVTNATSLGG